MKITLEGTASEINDAVERLGDVFRIRSVSTQKRNDNCCSAYVDAEVPVKDLYQSVIRLKDDIPNDRLCELSLVIEKAFENRAGCVRNTSNTPGMFVFQGNRNDVGCMELAMFELRDTPGVLDYVQSWDWIDEDPCECCSILDIFARHPK